MPGEPNDFVKARDAPAHPSGVLVEGTAETAGKRVSAEPTPLDVASIHSAHAEFVWASLQRLGVRDADLEDMLQEVFIVVHRRLDSFDGSSRLTTWLFGVAIKVAAGYRRRAYNRRERATEDVPEDVHDPNAQRPVSAEEQLSMKQARARLDVILDEMDLDRRAVFVMFEVEEMSCEEIATIVGVPVGTVYSRLSKARKEFEAGLARMKARDARVGAGR